MLIGGSYCSRDNADMDAVISSTSISDVFENDQGPAPGDWVTLPAGTFTMGSPSDELCRTEDEMQHQVTLTHSFEIEEHRGDPTGVSGD